MNVSFKHSSSLHSVTANVYRLQILLISPKKESYWSITAYYLLKMYSCKLHADHEAPIVRISCLPQSIFCVCVCLWVCMSVCEVVGLGAPVWGGCDVAVWSGRSGGQMV